MVKTAAERKRKERAAHKRAGRVPVTVQVLPKFRAEVRALESEFQRRELSGTSANGETPNVKLTGSALLPSPVQRGVGLGATQHIIRNAQQPANDGRARNWRTACECDPASLE